MQRLPVLPSVQPELRRSQAGEDAGDFLAGGQPGPLAEMQPLAQRAMIALRPDAQADR